MPAASASDHSKNAEEAISTAGQKTLRTVSRFAYTSTYVVSYGVVFGAVFLVRLLPAENPIMYGFRDGGRAAMDALNTV